MSTLALFYAWVAFFSCIAFAACFVQGDQFLAAVVWFFSGVNATYEYTRLSNRRR